MASSVEFGSDVRRARRAHRGISERRLPPCPPRVRGSGHARGANQRRHGVGHAPAVLLGGSPLDMAAPPSPSSLCGRDHANISAPHLTGLARMAAGPSPRSQRGRRGGYRAPHGPEPTHPKPRNSGPRSPDGSRRTCPRAGAAPSFSMTPEERKAFNEEWTAKLFAGGWICASWPTEYGGKGLSLLQQVVLNEEFARVGAPLRADFFGDTLVGPTILQWGTEEQKQQFIPGILKGEIAWCQGFSEPDAGSDLAGLKTRAELDGDEWVINGQKVWTTQAHYADYIFLLARTDPDAPKHAGISYLLVPMKQPGVEVRPIEQIDGSAEFNEVFFTNVRCPKDNVIGGVNNGWKVAMTTLGFERGTSSTTGHRRFQKEFDQILAEARATWTRQRSADPPAPGAVMVEDQDHADQRLPHADRRPQRDAHDGRAGRVQQDVLVGGAPGHDAARHGHPRHGRPDPAGRQRRATRCCPGPAGPGRATRSTTCSRSSSSRARRRSGAARPRSSATSWASARSACPRSPSPPEPRRPPYPLLWAGETTARTQRTG